MDDDAGEGRLAAVCFSTMLRKIVGTGRKHQESYVDWLIRATHYSENLAVKHGIESSVTLQVQRKLALHSKISGCADSRWAQVLLDWESLCARCPGRPRMRWKDALAKHTSGVEVIK